MAHEVRLGSRERRAREKTDTRQQIIDAAREMFVERGYEATTMRAIAEKVEYTATAIYHHFRNKEELLTELAATDFKALSAAFRRIGKVADPLERLRRIGDAFMTFALEHPMQYQLMFMTPRPMITMTEIKQGDPREDAYAFLRSAWSEAIAARRLRPEYTDADALAQMCLASMHGVLALHFVKHNAEHPGGQWIHWRDPRRTAAGLSEAMIRGVEATSKA